MSLRSPISCIITINCRLDVAEHGRTKMMGKNNNKNKTTTKTILEYAKGV